MKKYFTNAPIWHIIKYSPNQPRDENGRWTDGGGSKKQTATPKKPKSQKISKKEYKRLCSQIATDFPNLKADGEPHYYENRNHFYVFTVNGVGDYSFYKKIPIDGNEEYIEEFIKPR